MDTGSEAHGAVIQDLIRTGAVLYGRGWVPATSGNFSARLPDGNIAITVSGRDKGSLDAEGILTVDTQGRPLQTGKRPSAETLLHTALYRRFPQVGAVLHTHSRNATLASRVFQDALVLGDLELLKAFEGIATHEARLRVPIFANDQDIARLAAAVDAYLDGHDDVRGYLIAGHGIYTWGRTLQDALRHLEAFEFLFECELFVHSMVKQ